MNAMTAWGHILLAEDNPVNQRVTSAMLERLGFHVDIVADGTEAVSAAAVTPYRAILMDCQLPVLDGYLAASEIRRWQGASRRTPIIGVTASASPSEQRRCRSAGMDDLVTKPLTMTALTAVLARWAPDDSDPSAPDADEPVLAGTAHPVDPAIPPLDAVVVDRLERLGADAGEDLLGQLIVLFQADAANRVQTVRRAIDAEDSDAVFVAAHTLAGASANLGATELARLCTSLAVDGEAGDLSHAEPLLAAIDRELARVRTALDVRISAS